MLTAEATTLHVRLASLRRMMKSSISLFWNTIWPLITSRTTVVPVTGALNRTTASGMAGRPLSRQVPSYLGFPHSVSLS